MIIDTASIPGPHLAEYANVSIAFEVTSVLLAQPGTTGTFVLTERPVDQAYVKDYDALGERPETWVARFDTSRWGLFLARAEGRSLGGATVAFGTAGLDMLEGRNDLAVLLDIRVAPDARGQGVGRALFEAAVNWAHARGCRELKVETQNVNVAACRFYAAMDCQLRVVREHAYPDCPGEAQFMFYKTLRA